MRNEGSVVSKLTDTVNDRGAAVFIKRYTFGSAVQASLLFMKIGK